MDCHADLQLEWHVLIHNIFEDIYGEKKMKNIFPMGRLLSIQMVTN